MTNSDSGTGQSPQTGEAVQGPKPGTQETMDDAQSGEPDTNSQDSAEEATLPLDQAFEILKNSRRRETLHYLNEHGGTATLSSLAEHIAAIENDTTVQQITSSQRKRVYVGLYQCHLPKMDSMDVIDFDKNRGTIELARNAEQVCSYLGDSDSGDWYKLYLGLAVAGSLLFVISIGGAAKYGLQPSVVLFLLLGGMFLGSVAHAMGVDVRSRTS
ncbi:DUF7344 domain-containing protein [Halobacteriaceae archaeon SHR40]|uniref:DUF7344 domain-containing protein n=1 Tax=Halovenus amylolytica TaxID=2500550 RepID=UPI000FE3AF63